MEEKISIIEEKMRRRDLQNEDILLPPYNPELLGKMMEKEKEKLLTGKNIKSMGSPDEQQLKKLRRLEDRMEDAEDEIFRIREILRKK